LGKKVVFDRVGRIREIFSRSAIGDAAVAIPVLHFRVLDVYVGLSFVRRAETVVRTGADGIRLRLGGILRDFNAGARVRRAGEEIRREGLEPGWIRGLRSGVHAAGIVAFDPSLGSGRDGNGVWRIHTADFDQFDYQGCSEVGAGKRARVATVVDVGGADRGSSLRWVF